MKRRQACDLFVCWNKEGKGGREEAWRRRRQGRRRERIRRGCARGIVWDESKLIKGYIDRDPMVRVRSRLLGG